MNVVSDCLLTEALLIGHRSCIGSVYSTYGLRERTNCGRGCSFSFFSCRNYYRDKEALRQMKQKKTCGKNQHVRIDNIYRKANLICCRTDDAVEINLRYYTGHWQKYFNHMVRKYNRTHTVQLPGITPHVCRHTYCTNMARAGMNPKSLQYLMGHSEIETTLDVYTHFGYEEAKKEVGKVNGSGL